MYEEFRQYLGPVRPCAICQRGDDAGAREVWAREEYFTALRCTRCGLVQVDPGLTPEGLTFYYSTYLTHRLEDTLKFEQRRVQYQQDAAFLQRFVTSGRILDVGCSGGFFLDALGAGYDRVGLEIDPEAARFARETFGLDVRAAILGEDGLDDGQFDVIMFRGVIEHIYDPGAALARATALLKPGGRIYCCATPNLNAFCAEVYREKWNLWHPVQHINIFTVETLHQLAGTDRFDVEGADYPYLGTPYEQAAEDYRRVAEDVPVLQRDRSALDRKSPPFWGNMMSVVYRMRGSQR
ncbi:MAG: class I SAM-dependent methyltransferase [Acidobacteria bacterium]|nr:class I SAM-dependent methyltransferase [Acidobacteriota bacterium]